MDDDIERVDRCVAGEREAFDELVIKYQKPLYAMLYRMVSNREDAADILQKTFVRAFTGLARFERRSSFKTWLYQIAINLAKNLYRERSRAVQVSIDDVVIRKDPKTLDALITRERREQLRRAVGQLPEKQRLTLLLRVQENKQFDEIAAIMQSSLGTAKANYHHAVQKLKKIMGEERSQESEVKSQESGSRESKVRNEK